MVLNEKLSSLNDSQKENIISRLRLLYNQFRNIKSDQYSRNESQETVSLSIFKSIIFRHHQKIYL